MEPEQLQEIQGQPQLRELVLVLYNKLSCPAGCMAMRGILLQATLTCAM